MASNNNNLTKGNIWKQLIVFSLPLMLSNLFQQFYNTADTLVVGRFVGSTALAAVGSTGSVNGLVIGFFMGMGTGSGVIISQAFGNRDLDQLRKGVHTAVALAIVLGLGLGLIGVLITPSMLRWMKTPSDVFEQAVLYLRVNFAGLITLTIYNMGAGILRALGDSRRPFYYLIISGITNIVLNMIFVIVFRMGVVGVSLATVISQALSSVLVIWNLTHAADESYRLNLRSLRIDRGTFIKIAKIGLPAGVQSMVISLSNIIIQSQINIFGSAAMAGNSAASRIDAFVYMPLNALSLGVTTFVAQNLGAGNLERAKKGARTCMLLALIVTAGLGWTAVLFSRPLMEMFTTDAEVLRFAVFSNTVRCGAYFLFVPTDVLAGTIRGAGNAVVPMIISLVNMCLVRIVWLFIAIPIWHEFWVAVICHPLTWALASVCYLIYYLHGSWLKKWQQNEKMAKTKAV